MAFNKTKYHQEYVKRKLKRIPLEVSLEKYDQIKEHTEKTNQTVNGFIKCAIDEALERDANK